MRTATNSQESLFPLETSASAVPPNHVTPSAEVVFVVVVIAATAAVDDDDDDDAVLTECVETERGKTDRGQAVSVNAQEEPEKQAKISRMTKPKAGECVKKWLYRRCLRSSVSGDLGSCSGTVIKEQLLEVVVATASDKGLLTVMRSP